jgi:hypothetical protein
MSDEFYIEMYSSCKNKMKWENHANDFPSFKKVGDALAFAKKDYKCATRHNFKNKIIYQIIQERDNGYGNIPTHLHVSNVECKRDECKHYKIKNKID